jgi:hypothetical protein
MGGILSQVGNEIGKAKMENRNADGVKLVGVFLILNAFKDQATSLRHTILVWVVPEYQWQGDARLTPMGEVKSLL